MEKFLIGLFLVFSAFSFNNSSFAQNETEDIIENFFDRYEQSPTEAIDYLFGTSNWMESNKDGIIQVKTQLNNFIVLVGDYKGFEKIEEVQKGESLKQLTYFVKYDRQPIRFIFLFYKPDNVWQIQNFNFDDKILEF